VIEDKKDAPEPIEFFHQSRWNLYSTQLLRG